MKLFTDLLDEYLHAVKQRSNAAGYGGHWDAQKRVEEIAKELNSFFDQFKKEEK